jgi:ribosomal-protein-serine acetyltransferase
VNPIYWELGDGVAVRSFISDDAQTLAALVEANVERLSRWFPWVQDSRHVDGARAFIERARGSEVDLEANGLWVEGRLVGAIGMSVDTVSNGSEIGYWLDEGSEGRGLVTTACRRFIDHGFGVMGLHRVTIRAAVQNLRSRAVAERLGFTQEGLIRGSGRVGDGTYVDLVIYGMLENDWPASE